MNFLRNSFFFLHLFLFIPSFQLSLLLHSSSSMRHFSQSPTCAAPVVDIEERSIILSMPELSSISSDDGDLQDDQDSENDSNIGPLTTAQYGDGDDDNDLPTSSISETDEDEETEDSDGDEINDNHSQDEDNEDDIGSPGPKMGRRKKIGTGLSVKSYFDLMKPVGNGGVAAAAIQLKCTKTESPLVPIDFRSKSVEWTIYPHELDSTKDYELVIGISAKNLGIVDIEEVVFTVNGVEERVGQESLKDEELDESVVLQWKLATPKPVQNNNRMEMHVGLALKLKPMAVPLETQTFNLYYMELHAVGTMNSSKDVRVLRPLYDWALDIRRSGTDDTIPYAISESGDYLVTYRTAIELWELTNSSASTHPHSMASTDPFSISAAELEHLGLSISWDGSQIAVFGKGSAFKLFELDRPKSMLEKSSKAKTADLVKFEGRGSFHKGIESQRQGQDDEIFVAVDQDSVSIYRVCGAWEFLRTICHTSPRRSTEILDARSTIRGIGDRCQARHFICRNMDTEVSETEYETQSIFIWNLDSGRLVRTIKAAGDVWHNTEFLSSDASLLLEEVDGVMSSFCSRSGVHLATTGYELGSAAPVRGGTAIFHTSDGLIRSGIDFSPMYPSCKLTESARVLWISKESESFKAFVEDRFRIFQQTWKSSPCNKDCLATLNAPRKNVLSFIDFESRLQFSVRGNVSSSVTLVITDLSHKRVPQDLVLEKENPGIKWNVTFSPKERALIVEGGTLTSVYEMPRRFGEDITLVSIQDPQDQHKICVHERSYFGFRQSFSSLLQLKKNQLAAAAPALFSQPYWHYISDNDYLPRYINRHINQRDGFGDERNTQGDVKFSMMERLCGQWDGDENPIIMTEKVPMLNQVLDLPECQWVPQSNKEFNPVQYFLEKAKTVRRAKAAFDLLSDHCHQKAKSEQNLLFLSPIAACLPTLLDPGLPHTKRAILALQKMAFFPVPLRSVIIERHTVIRPPEFRFKFWNPNTQPLFQCRGPILQLESSGASDVEVDVTKDAFGEEIFAATFNMIWTDKSEPDALRNTSYPAGESPSMLYWIKMLPFVVVYKLKPRQQKAVICHEFPLDALDNPALSALILYKWITLGFYIWFTRFVFQCLFYALVIVTVLLQVYAPSHSSVVVLSGMIGVMSSIFLLLELSQALSNPTRYFKSLIYNLVDIAVFALPLGGCINQFMVRSTGNEDNHLNPRGPNSWLFSFSILIIAFHLLFELRVMKTVCQFVSAIVRIFSRIGIFSIIFLVGLLAFTTALLHLLRGCVQEPCAELTTGFPDNFYLAFSATFFFMGGKYDPISDVFAQPNWAFNTMMIIYLFFTVILMLNVLIAVIYSGYDESDTTWELVWLQNRLLYIESIENLSHSIPGLREKYDIFPQEIYYCLSEAKIQEYKTCWSKKDGLWSPNEDDLWTGPNETKKDLLGQKVKKLEQEADELQQEVGELQQKVGELQQETDELQEEVGELQEEVGELHQEVDDLRLQALERMVEKLQQEADESRRKEEKRNQEIELIQRRQNEKRLMALMEKGGRIDTIEQQLERIEKLLTRDWRSPDRILGNERILSPLLPPLPTDEQ